MTTEEISSSQLSQHTGSTVRIHGHIQSLRDMGNLALCRDQRHGWVCATGGETHRMCWQWSEKQDQKPLSQLKGLSSHALGARVLRFS